jgi:RNA polymerase sigma-70 factor (ECF subfamily)
VYGRILGALRRVLLGMEQIADLPSGTFDARYVAFLETIATLRPKLHRYCARMTGSVLDGEDVMQDALFHAYRKLEQFDESRPLAPWLFRIAHNQCIDFLRRREVREGAEAEAIVDESIEPTEALGHGLDRALEHLVLSLPPKERACVLLKDVFGYSLEEIAELVDSTVGGVKAALNRGRTKLDAIQRAGAVVKPAEKRVEVSPLLTLYLERFNRRDWDGLLELISADARLRVADRYFGDVASAPYYTNYAKRPAPWRAAMGALDGESVIVVFQARDGAWNPVSLIRIEERENRVARIIDYNHCPWVLSSADSLLVEAPAV